VSSFKIAEWA